jgi:hypothetical protein|tara:strand:- start:172 stop:366 length:195 start_codon:yes stop_codon:yes gene_type:complete
MSLKAFVNNKSEWDAFCEELDILILEQQRRLEQSEVAIDLHRCQGSISTLRRLKYLRDKVNGSK